MPQDTRICPILDYDIGPVLYSVRLVGALTVWQQRGGLLRCQLVGRGLQLLRELLVWRCAGLMRLIQYPVNPLTLVVRG